jgi:multisubunit Na+/H+ antiporter MnhE subunit
MEHLIFTFHNQTTWFVLFGIAVGFNSILESSAATWIATLVFGFYLYKAFRRFYGQGRVKTILKFIIINFIFFILAIVAALFSVLASFAIY